MQIDDTTDANEKTGLKKQGRWRRARAVLRCVPVLCVGLACLGFLTRITLRDRVALLALVYYAVPLIVQAGLLIVAGAWWALGRQWRRAAPCWVGAAVLLLVWHHANFMRGPQNQASGRPRVVLWNISRGSFGVDAVVAKLRERDPDVIALVEAGRVDNTDFWKKKFPGYQGSDCRGGLMVLARGKLVQEQYVRLDAVRYMTLRVEAAGLAFRMVHVDLIRDPWRSRQEPIEVVQRLVERWANEPLVVTGDFNTPADSVWFDNWREKMNHAFDQSGNGYFATWPSPLPIMAIDQAWVSRSLETGHCRLIDTLRSDHAMVEFDLAPAR